MTASLLRNACVVLLLGACATSSKNKELANDRRDQERILADAALQDKKPASLMELPQTQDGGFVLKPGFYEAEFKTYCLQPGTPDPRPGDAYLQGPVTGNRKEIVETVLLESRNKPDIPQRNVQLLLWSVVSNSDFNKLPARVQSDAGRLLTPRQIFQLKGGMIGFIKTVSNSTGLLNSNSDMQRLFALGTSSYESFERLAVLREPSRMLRKGVNYDQWYKQEDNYYVRYFPASYQKVRIQVYVPQELLNADGKVNGEYLVFDPTGQQAMPAFTNAQRLGVGGPLLDVVRVIIQVNKETKDKKLPVKKRRREEPTKQLQ